MATIPDKAGDQMRALVLNGPKNIELVDVAEPEAVPESVVVQIDRCGIGGSDIEAYADGRLPAGAWFGHEWVGHIVEVGEGLRDRFVGEIVLGAVPPPCGSCRPCRAGYGTHCRVVIEMIVGADPLASSHGAFAERIRVDARRVQRLPEGIDVNDAALAEPAAVAMHAIRRSTVGIGDIVVVVGAGTIGLLVAELARLAGAARVAAIDPESVRRELVCDLGADAAFAPGQELDGWLTRTGHGLGADVVFDCSGGEGELASAITQVRRGGEVVAVGVSSRTSNTITSKLIEREVTIRASLGYTVSDVRRVLSLMAEDALHVANIYDPIALGLNQVADTIESMSASGAAGSKRLVAPNS